ncbi:hypothetical protein GB937_002376 [Aspergillus fischeri]|nr:hypothetical protein GB937_002376 [Aspergillus fischeri]
MNVANFRRSGKTSKVEAKELSLDDITIYKESRLDTCSESKRSVSLDCNRNQEDVVRNCPCQIKIVCMALSLMLCAALIWLGYLPLECLSGIATRQVSASTSNTTDVLEVFQVYQPVSTTGGADSACDDEILLMDHVFAYSYGKPFVGDYNPPKCDFDTVRINLTVTSRGRQYDRLAIMYLGDAEVFRTSTAEPTTNGIVWTYIKEMSQYNALWKEPQKLIFDLGNLISDVYTGSFNATLIAVFAQRGTTIRTADMILPISARKSASNASSALIVPSDNVEIAYRLPSNTARAIVSISACGQSTEEFWWSNVFSPDTESFVSTVGELYGYSPFREIQLYIDGLLAGVIWPFPIIFTGGVSPGFWRPIVGIDAFDLRQPEIDISPFLPLLTDGRGHSFEIKIVGLEIQANGTARLSDSVGSYWVVTGNIFLYLEEDASYSRTDRSKKVPQITAPTPQFTITRLLTKDKTGVNDTLSYSVVAERTLSITSTQFTWHQSLKYSNSGLLSRQGLSQANHQLTSGKISAAEIGVNGSTDDLTFEYPLFVNTTYGIADTELTINAHMDRGLDIAATGVTGISTYTLTSGPSRLHTRQWGSAFYRSVTGGGSTSAGDTTDVFESIAEQSYHRTVRAINGSVVTDTDVRSQTASLQAIQDVLLSPGRDSVRSIIGRGPGGKKRKQSQDGCGDGRSLLFGVPDSLATAFAQSGRLAQSGQLESDGPPSKRRKLTSAPQSLRDVNGASENGVPNGYIALARFDLNLKFAHANPLSEKHVDDPLTPLPRLPVVLQSAGNSRHLASWTHESTSYDCFELEIATLAERETVYKESSTSPQLLEFGKHLESAHRLVCADRYHKKAPIACYQCTLHCSTDRKSFRLETLILWKDSLNIIDEKLLNARALDTFAKYVLQRDAEVYNKARNMGFAPAAIWSPRDFYDNVHVPQDTPESSAEIKSNLIHCRLYPFQRRAVRWLLEREGVKLQENGHVFPLEDKSASELPTSFEKRTDAEGKTYYVSPLFVTVTSDLSNWYAPADYLKGGILAEEMGLGKTVEMISLMCLHRRSLQPDMDLEIGGMRQSGATLIITPPAILQQWMQEIQLHAPALHVLHYTGINRHQKLSDRELLELLADQDVVLTTYDVLAREIHYSGDAPKRNLRHEKRFQPRKSPLVKISWWRVCLDEAQMIESGVSNAAKVARLIPRQNAWAVTGTPLRKDISDLLGLLLFLHYEPFCGFVWNRLCRSFHSVLSGIVSRVALRHSKDHVRSELDLPSQKRFVITIPFTAVEEQHYAQLFEQMAEDCGLDMSGAPLKDDWNPEDQAVVEKMRSWLMRLRQACLYPAGSGRRVLGFGGGPLRSVAEVLEIMIDQNDALVHAEERALVQSQLRRGQLLENALRRQQALELWTKSYERSSALVKECRIRLQLERDKSRATADGVSQGGATDDPVSDNEVDEADKNTRVSAYRQRLRAALEIQHVSIFFIGNVFYQIRTDPKLTEPDSEEFKRLEKRETESYEEAKLIRMEILSDVSRKVARYMKVIREKSERKQFVVIPKMKPQLYSKGLEARRIFDRYEEFCEVMNKHAVQYNEWRDIMVKLLSQSLIDQEDESELEGNEYERSTKHQDEMYVYMEALRAMFADRHDALTGQQNVLIAHEVKGGIIQAQQGEGPSPALFLSVMNTRSALKPAPALGSLRGIISELRSLATSLEWQGSGGSSRALAELELVNSVLQHAAKMAAEQNKVSSNLEREVEMFRDTMNNRLEYYRQLQQISDMVAPYDEESVGKPLDEDLYAAKLKQENDIDAKISTLRSKHRYLLHLRDDSGVDNASRICVICQSSFEIGVLTVCGHKYCKDCLRIWWNQHRTCPTCKKRLKVNDFHQITYKPEEFVVQEEKTPKLESGRSSNSFIYADISSGTLKEIKNIDLEASFGTKIDTLARHILWLREHDPGAKSIIFSQYKTFLEVLGTAFSRFKIGYSSIDNADGIERFKSDPAVECFFLHAKAQSSGLNLVNATHVFLCEPLVNTAIELQAIARVHRIGQHRPTTVWMYLVSDTVEQSIYELSVSRRLAHIVQKEKVKEALDDPGAVFKNLTETAIDSANSLEVQDATLAKLMTKGTAGGELVKKDDLWQCLFGNATQKLDLRADGEVARFLRGDAAEKRRTAASS